MAQDFARPPAPIEPRVLAGALDGFVVLLMCAGFFFVPLLARGLVLPMVGVLVAVVVYLVVPLSAFGQTLGMRLFGLELINRRGRTPNAGDVLFRELVGRGFLPAGYVFTVLLGIVGRLTGVATFLAPSGLAAVFFHVSWFVASAAAFGHAYALLRPDRRIIADLFAQTMVVPAQPAVAPTDEDERAEWSRQRTRRVVTALVFQVVGVVGGLALPFVLTSRSAGSADYADRLMLKKREKSFEADPSNPKLATELASAYRQVNEPRAAQEALRRHEEAVAKKEAAREGALRAAVDRNPDEEGSVSLLVSFLLERERYDEAKAVYRRYVERAPSIERQVGFAEWLGTYGFHDDAVQTLRPLVQTSPDQADLRRQLAFALVGSDRLEEAQEQLFLVLLADPADDECRGELDDVDGALGPLPLKRRRELEREWKTLLAKRVTPKG